MTLLVLVFAYLYCRVLEIMYKLKALAVAAVIVISVIVEEMRVALFR